MMMLKYVDTYKYSILQQLPKSQPESIDHGSIKLKNKNCMVSVTPQIPGSGRSVIL